MINKIKITFDIEVEGDLTDEQIINYFQDYQAFPHVICPPDSDDLEDDWAIIINGYKIEGVE